MLAIKDVTRAMLPAVHEFWRSAYGEAHVLGRDPALFEWQFGPRAGGAHRSETPTEDDLFHMKVAVDGDTVVACLGFVPIDVRSFGIALRGCWLANWKVAPEYARRGLGPLLMQAVTRTVDVIVNVGISDDAQHILRRMGWLDLGRMHRWVRALDPTRASTLLDVGASAAWSAPRSRVPSEYVTHEVATFGESAGRTWDHIWGVRGAGARRSPAMLAWRYSTHPTFRYQQLEIRDGADGVVGFGVYRLEEVRSAGVTIGRIVELVAHDDAEASLVDAVCDHAEARGAVLLDFYCLSDRLAPVLRDRGFDGPAESVSTQVPHLFQPIDRRRGGIACMISPIARGGGDVVLPVDARDWYATKGDADQDRPT